MSWMHDRALAPRSRRLPRQTAPMSSLSGTVGAAPEDPAAALGSARNGGVLIDLEAVDHVGIPQIITRRARWVTSRLRQR